jgi:hypothetical protein
VRITESQIMGVFFQTFVPSEHCGEHRILLMSVTLKRQEILARDLSFAPSRMFALKVDFHKVSDSKVKLEGQEEIRNTHLAGNFSKSILRYVCIEGRYLRSLWVKCAAGRPERTFESWWHVETVHFLYD